MKDDTYTIREIIIALTSMPNLSRSLSGKGKKYDVLLNEVMKHDYFSEDSHLQSGKELQEATKLSAQKCKAQLVEIYNDFLELIGNENSPYHVNPVRYEFYVKDYDKSKFFYGSIPCPPHVGEVMQFTFLRPIFKIDTFRVERVKHVLREDYQLIEVWLKGGDENTYERFLVDQAKYEGRYDYREGKIR